MKVTKAFICKTQAVAGKDKVYQQGQWVPKGEDVEMSDKDVKLYPGCFEGKSGASPKAAKE